MHPNGPFSVPWLFFWPPENIFLAISEKAWTDLFPVQEFLHDQSDCRILRHHVNRPHFWSWCARVQAMPGRSAVFAVLPWRKGTAGPENKAFPCCSHILSQCIVRLVAEFQVTVSVRLPPVKVWVTELSVTTPWKRLLDREAATGLYLPRLWPPAETQSLYTRLPQSGSSLVSDRFCHWQN